MQPIEYAVKFRLNHNSFLPWARGTKGEILELRKEDAEKLIAIGGGEIIEDLNSEKEKSDVSHRNIY